jgi:MFS family permease
MTTPAPDRFAPDGAYAWLRLAASLVLGTLACVGTWSIVVVLPTVEAAFGTQRAGAAFPYTLVMVGFATGSVIMGRVADRFGIVVPILAGAVSLAAGYVAASLAPNLWAFAVAHLFIGFGAASGFSVLIADLSHWFRRNRALAVVFAATGSYLAGALWPQVISAFAAGEGWRAVHFWIGVGVPLAMVALTPVFRPRPAAAELAATEAAAQAKRGDLGISPRALQALLAAAGFSCCVAMSMPQVHIVAYCADLGYGPAVGADMLSLMLALGVISRIGSGFIADRIGGAATLFLGSFMQAVALFLYLWFDGLSSLFLISAIFGLFQGGIVPMYAVVIRDYLPPREAGVRIGIVMMMTILGMAAGGWLSGLIFDLTASYRMAFLNGLLWNFVNLAIVAFVWLGPRRRLAVA